MKGLSTVREVHRNGQQKRIDVTAETITPEIAADWLAANTSNRKMKDPRVKRLASVIRSGEWQNCNGETIKFSSSGRLIDGQHRLAAVVMANIPITTLVVRNVDEESFRTIDSGSRRSTADGLFILGEKNETQLAATLNALYRWNQFKRFVYTSSPTTTELLDTLQENPEIRDSIPLAGAIYKKLPGAPISLFACLHYVCGQINKTDADGFFFALRDGLGLSRTDSVWHLRERLSSIRPSAGNGFRYQDELGALIIKCWNYYRQGKTMNRLIYRPSLDAYPTPE